MTDTPGRAAAALCLILALTGCATPTDTPATGPLAHAANTEPKRVLFVGNSYLYYNDSVHNHVRRIAQEKNPDAADDYRYKSATISGAVLAQHDLTSLLQPGRLGIDQPFDLVILQGGSGESLSDNGRQRFGQTAAALATQIRATGAEVALYMTPAYVAPHRLYDPTMIDVIEQTYVSTGKTLGAVVIPVGLAFKRAYARRPEMVLHKTFDGSHPSLLGTYLAACVVYASVYQQSVENVQYNYFGAISDTDARFLQNIATRTVNEFSR